MKYLPYAFLCAYMLFYVCREAKAQIVYANQLISYTSCGIPCNQGVVNAAASADANTVTFSEMRNNLGVGSFTSIETGFSVPASPQALVVVPVRKAGLLSDLALLQAIRVEVLDPLGNVIVQRSGINASDLNVLNASQSLYALSIRTPPGSYTIGRVRVTLGGILNVLSQLYLGDPFYVNASSGCGLQYANTLSASGTTGVCALCSVSSASNVTDASYTNYATMSVPVGVGGRTYIEVAFPTAGNTGDFAGFIIGDGSGLLDITLLGNIDVATYHGASLVESHTVSSLLGLAVLSGGTPSSLVGFNATAPFNRLRISMGALASVLATMRVYAAVKYDPTPPLITLTAAPDTIFCEGTAASITASGSYSSYSWNTGQSGHVITPSASGRYMVTAHSEEGCPFYSAPMHIVVNPRPALPTIQSANINCLGGNALIKAYQTQASMHYQLRVSGGGAAVGPVLNGNNDTLYLFSDAMYANTSYTVEVSNPLNGCQAQVAVPVTVTVPAAPASVFTENDHSGCWVKPGDRYIHFMQPGTSRIIASLNPQGSDLGWVEFRGYSDAAVPEIQSCDASQPQFLQSALQKHWTIRSGHTPVANVGLRLYYNDADFTNLSAHANANLSPTDDVSSPADLKLSKYSGTAENGSFADNCGTGTITLHLPAESGSVSTVQAGFTISGASFSGYTVSGFSELWLSGAGNSPLPAHIQNWEAECISGQWVQASWQSVSESNNAFFILESSADEVLWTEIYRLPGAGNSNEIRSYNTGNLSLPAAHRYLRLQQQDHNGMRSIKAYGSIYCMPGSNKEMWQIYPNPAADVLTLQGPLEQYGNQRYELRDMSGKILLQGKINASATNQFGIPLGNLHTGMYLLYVYGPQNEVFRFLKQ